MDKFGTTFAALSDPTRRAMIERLSHGSASVHGLIDGAHDVITFEDYGNGQTKLTFIGNEPMESAINSGQVEGWNQILEKVAAVVAGLAQAK